MLSTVVSVLCAAQLGTGADLGSNLCRGISRGCKGLPRLAGVWDWLWLQAVAARVSTQPRTYCACDCSSVLHRRSR